MLTDTVLATRARASHLATAQRHLARATRATREAAALRVSLTWVHVEQRAAIQGRIKGLEKEAAEFDRLGYRAMRKHEAERALGKEVSK